LYTHRTIDIRYAIYLRWKKSPAQAKFINSRHIKNDSTEALQIQENFCSNNQNVMSQDGKQIIEECSIQLLRPGLIVVIPAYLPLEWVLKHWA